MPAVPGQDPFEGIVQQPHHGPRLLRPVVPAEIPEGRERLGVHVPFQLLEHAVARGMAGHRYHGKAGRNRQRIQARVSHIVLVGQEDGL